MTYRTTQIRIVCLALSALFCLMLPFAATAQQRPESKSRIPWPSKQLPPAPIKVRVCSCLYAGENIPIGRTICMKFQGKHVRATCDAVVNNPSWSISTTPCPST